MENSLEGQVSPVPHTSEVPQTLACAAMMFVTLDDYEDLNCYTLYKIITCTRLLRASIKLNGHSLSFWSPKEQCKAAAATSWLRSRASCKSCSPVPFPFSDREAIPSWHEARLRSAECQCSQSKVSKAQNKNRLVSSSLHLTSWFTSSKGLKLPSHATVLLAMLPPDALPESSSPNTLPQSYL